MSDHLFISSSCHGRRTKIHRKERKGRKEFQVAAYCTLHTARCRLTELLYHTHSRPNDGRRNCGFLRIGVMQVHAVLVQRYCAFVQVYRVFVQLYFVCVQRYSVCVQLHCTIMQVYCVFVQVYCVFVWLDCL